MTSLTVTEDDKIFLNLYNHKVPMDERKHRSMLAMILTIVLSIFVLLFITGCVLSVDKLVPDEIYPNKPKNCSVFSSKTSFTSEQSLVYNPNEPVMLGNSSASKIICYGYVLGDKKKRFDAL